MKKVLFVCTQNRLRSPTAEKVFENQDGIIVKSAGLDPHAKTHLTLDLIDWADIIFTMEKSHQNEITKKYGLRLKRKKLICLDIPDEYDYMQKELIEILNKKVLKYIK